MTQGSSAGSLIERLAGLPAAEQRQVVLDLIRREAAAVLGNDDAGSIGVDRPFQELGFNSLTAVDLRNRLAEATGAGLPATLAFDHPTPAALTDLLLSTMAPAGQPAAPPVIAELDRLESLLATIGRDDEHHHTITVRLRAIASRWRDETPRESGAASAIEAASAAEILDFIDNELGRAKN